MFHNLKSKKEDNRRIEVIMADGIHHQVTPRVLDILLDSNRVTKFKRSGSWVTVGVGLVRAKRRSDYCPLHYGPDQRVSS
jgi:hypothetical protein